MQNLSTHSLERAAQESLARSMERRNKRRKRLGVFGWVGLVVALLAGLALAIGGLLVLGGGGWPL